MVKLESNEITGGSLFMAKKITNKKPLFGNKRSHALNSTRKKQKPNFQKITLDDGSTIVMSARELKTFKKSSKKVETEME